MIGFAYTSPIAVSVAIDRTKFRSFLLTSENFDDEVEAAKEVDDDRKNVLLVPSAKDLKTAKFDSFEAVVVFDTAQILSDLPDVTILDADLHDDSVWQIRKLSIESINESLAGDISAVPEGGVDLTVVDEVVEDHKPKKTTRGSIGKEFVVKLQEVLENMKDKDDQAEFTNSSCKYIAGTMQTRTYTKARKDAIAAGADEEKLKALMKLMNSKTGQNLFAAFYHHCVDSKTLEDLASKYKVELDDLNYIAGIVPPSDSLPFVGKPTN
jgi:hypothetical protein